MINNPSKVYTYWYKPGTKYPISSQLQDNHTYTRTLIDAISKTPSDIRSDYKFYSGARGTVRNYYDYVFDLTPLRNASVTSVLKTLGVSNDQ